MKNPTKTLNPSFYTFKQLAIAWGTDAACIAGMVWDKQELRAAIPYSKLKLKEYIKPVDLSPSNKLKNLDCKLTFRNSGVSYENPFVYVRHENERVQSNKTKNSDRGYVKRAIITPAGFFKASKGRCMDDSDDIFCDIKGSSLIFDCRESDESSTSFENMTPVSYKLHLSDEYVITKEEKLRYEHNPDRGGIKENNLKKSIAVMALWMAEQKERHRSGRWPDGHYPNMGKIEEDICNFAKEKRLETKGFESLHTAIREGLKLLGVDRA